MKYITIALAKGRLAKQTLALLEQTGITCEEMKDKDTRKLIFINEELKLKFFLSKTSDVPTYVEYGAADLGVVGSDIALVDGHGQRLGRGKKSIRSFGFRTWQMQYVCCRSCFSKRIAA